MKKEGKIVISKNGPYVISGDLPLYEESIVSDDDGNSIVWKRGKNFPKRKDYALCRCGNSKDKPYCDRTHIKSKFDGAEIAKNKKFLDNVKKISGPKLELIDNIELCALARFCHNNCGNVWQLTRESDNLKSKKEAIKQTADCPAGRLVIVDKKTGLAIEPKFKPSISLIEDIPKGVGGPIWVKGGIPIESWDGSKYEIRNRVTLCRCGKSENKPYCDGAHIEIKFKGKRDNYNWE